jgi:hypothetical protein
VGKGTLTIAIAERPNAFDICAQFIIDGDITAVVRPDAGFL